MKAIAVGDLTLDAANRQVHFCQPPGGVIRFLAVDGDVAEATAMSSYELLRLDKHPG